MSLIDSASSSSSFNQPIFSLCLPAYQRAHLLAETIASALQQTLEDFELIIVDDHSPDDTEGVVQQFADPRIRFFRNPTNLGVPANYNRSFSLARGRFLLLLEDHDLLAPDYLARIFSIFERYPSVGFVATGLETIDNTGRALRTYVESFPEKLEGKRLLRRLLTRTTCPFSLTAAIRRELLRDKLEPFDPTYWWYADVNLWMQLAERSDFGYIAAPLLKFRIRESGHPLDDKEWKSLICIDRIHRDNWRLLYRRRSAMAYLDALQYEILKLRRAVLYRASRSLHGMRPWDDADRQQAAEYLSRASQTALEALNIVPSSVWRFLQHLRSS